MRVRAIAAALMLSAGAAQAQDAEAGGKAWLQCRSCHAIGPDARNGIGPVHNGLLGRRAGTVPGYGYSAAMRDSGLTWDEPTLREYLHDPKALVPGTKMLFAGLRSDRQITDLIAFLRQYDAEGHKAAP